MTPAGTSNELDVQNKWEENTHSEHFQQSMDQPGMVTSPARDQLNMFFFFSLVPVRA